MITIVLSADGTPTVWNADDWLTVREEHRIVGNLIGVLGHLPHQDVLKGLPCTLLPEEATLLIERKIARLSVFPSLKSPPQDTVKEAFCKHRETTYNEQMEHMRKERKRQLELVVDKIVEGRRKKLQGLVTKKQKKGKVKVEKEASEESSSKEEGSKVKASEESQDIPVVDRDLVLQEEMDRIPPLSKENTLVQTFTAFPWLREEDACPAKWTFPKTRMEKLRYSVFKDLWERGYFISEGHKFGGDFLVYPGDPLKFHSHFIVNCVEHNSKINAFQLVSCARVGSTVRKGFVLASMKPGSDKPMYQTIYWAGTGPF